MPASSSASVEMMGADERVAMVRAVAVANEDEQVALKARLLLDTDHQQQL